MIVQDTTQRVDQLIGLPRLRRSSAATGWRGRLYQAGGGRAIRGRLRSRTRSPGPVPASRRALVRGPERRDGKPQLRQNRFRYIEPRASLSMTTTIGAKPARSPAAATAGEPPSIAPESKLVHAGYSTAGQDAILVTRVLFFGGRAVLDAFQRGADVEVRSGRHGRRSRRRGFGRRGTRRGSARLFPVPPA